jgi:predicted TIM-barrel fold metal-dependent hydrolase
MSSTATIAAPFERPTAPRLKLPANAVDAHCHVFGPAARFAFSATRRYTPPDAPYEALDALHRHLGIDRAVLVQASVHGTDNSAMLDAVARANAETPHRWRAVAMADDNTPLDELKRWHRLGVRAVRFNFVQHLGGAPDLALVQRVIERISPLGWHLVLHLDADDLVHYTDFLDKLRLPFMIDHMGRPNAAKGVNQEPFQRLLALMHNPLAWVKICGAERISALGPNYSQQHNAQPWLDAVPFAQALLDVAPQRVIWGTDWPHPNVREMPNDGLLVDLLTEIAPSDLRQLVLVDNPQRLYWERS